MVAVVSVSGKIPLSAFPDWAGVDMDDLKRLPDDQVIPLALDGQREAWDVLIARHQRRVLLTLLARGVRVDRAHELTQETWTRLIVQQREGRLPWLELPGLAITQATYLAMDEARRSARSKPDLALDDVPEAAEVRDPSPSIEERLAHQAELRRADAELDRCPENARRVFELVYGDPPTSHADTAAAVGLSVQRVRQILCEVRGRLRDAMAEHGELVERQRTLR
jgi:RNA polymerase sigma-70 factor (ECF subfamily)